MSRLKDYIQLTKPTIMLLVLFTGATALVMEGSMLSDPLRFALVMLGLYLSGGSANALNQCFERDIDSKMSRTSKRRPLPLKRLTVRSSFIFSITIGLAGVALFAVVFNLLSGLLALGTILFYSLFYTLYLKPTTDQNIVIGGIAGAMGPLIAWAAASGALTLTPVILFTIVFLWTPPHFWALALFCQDDYRKIGMPMLPVVRGEETTFRWILYYTLAVVAVSLTLLIVGVGIVYAIVALALGVVFVKKVLDAMKARTATSERKLFFYSMIYLFALFFTIIVDGMGLIS
jgi:heme o synthase